MPHIEQIPSDLAWQIRQQAMYPGKKQKDIKLEGDKDGIHFGLFDQNQLISVVSWFPQNDTEAQFRKLATLEPFRNFGYGTLLVRYIIDFSERENIKTLWCNARVTALNFYEKLGFAKTEITFSKDGIDYVIMQINIHKQTKD